MAIALWTNNLARGVLVGVILSTLIFSWKIAQTTAVKFFDTSGSKRYTILGQIFFGSIANFVELFNYIKDPTKVVIDLRFRLCHDNDPSIYIQHLYSFGHSCHWYFPV